MPLRIEGIGPAPMTPEPDDAELAAMALLEHQLEAMSSRPSKARGEISRQARDDKRGGVSKTPDTAYYQSLASKIKSAHQMEAHLATRYVAYCEEMLKEQPDIDTLGTLMQGLFKHQDAAEREGGELKRRWQHCVANIALAQML